MYQYYEIPNGNSSILLLILIIDLDSYICCSRAVGYHFLSILLHIINVAIIQAYYISPTHFLMTPFNYCLSFARIQNLGIPKQ